MDAYAHFGLSAPPFEHAPDERFFFETPALGETLATIEFAFAAGKPCVLVLGPSGSGKTTIARQAAARLASWSRVLWIDPYDPRVRAATTPDAPAAAWRCLPEWLSQGGEPRKVVMVDGADVLNERGWRNVSAALSDRSVGGPLVILLGDHGWWRGAPEALRPRITARVFRTCSLRPLDADQAAAYVAHRLQVAGGDPEIIPVPTAREIARHALGVPGKLNRICDNALLEAYGDGRNAVRPEDVENALRALLGESPANETLALPGVPPAALPEPASANSPSLQMRPAGDGEQTDNRVAPDARLVQMEQRLARALRAIRDARTSHLRLGAPSIRSGSFEAAASAARGDRSRELA